MSLTAERERTPPAGARGEEKGRAGRSAQSGVARNPIRGRRRGNGVLFGKPSENV